MSTFQYNTVNYYLFRIKCGNISHTDTVALLLIKIFVFAFPFACYGLFLIKYVDGN